MLTIETVAVLGATEAGTACAVLAALAGCAVRLHDDGTGEALARAADALRRRVELAFAQGAISGAEQQAILDGVLFTADLDEALTGADLVVDAGGASPPPVGAARAGAPRDRRNRRRRRDLARRARRAAPAARTRPRAPRCAAGPVPQLEVEAAAATSPHVLEQARAFAARVNRAARLSGGSP